MAADDNGPYDDDDISTKPFVEQPQFSRHLGRRPIKFVAEGATIETLPAAVVPNGSTLADQYLAIVFPNGRPTPPAQEYPKCPTCNLPIKEADTRAHYLSLGHQLSLPRVPTPSGIDRTRMGLRYMEKHGYDVDARKGLGATGSGILYPIQPTEKADKLGIGIEPEKKKKVAEVKQMRLNAGQIRKKAIQDKKKDDVLRKMFYGDDKVEKYLGELEEHTKDANIISNLPTPGRNKSRR